MARITTSERNKRINLAIALLAKSQSSIQVISELQNSFGISERQAYRYLREAAKTKEALPIPEKKIVFTVKLPITLAERVREFAKTSGESISDLTTRALEHILARGEKRG